MVTSCPAVPPTGDGFYQVGHDLRITHHDRERLQVMADTMR